MSRLTEYKWDIGQYQYLLFIHNRFKNINETIKQKILEKCRRIPSYTEALNNPDDIIAIKFALNFHNSIDIFEPITPQSGEQREILNMLNKEDTFKSIGITLKYPILQVLEIKTVGDLLHYMDLYEDEKLEFIVLNLEKKIKDGVLYKIIGKMIYENKIIDVKITLDENKKILKMPRKMPRRLIGKIVHFAASLATDYAKDFVIEDITFMYEDITKPIIEIRY